MKKTTIRNWVLLGIILASAFLRLIWITSVPNSVNGDELHYLLSAKSLFLTGRDITQTTTLSQIFLFHYPQGDLVQAELPYVIEMATVGSMPFSLFGNALGNILFGILTVFLVYLLTRKLTDNDAIALIASSLSAINPWFIIMSRTSYEVIPATFFFLLAFYLLLRLRGWYILLVFPVFACAFYSYIATKLIFLPLAVVFVLYSYLFVYPKKFKIQYILVLCLCFLLMGFFLLSLKYNPSSSRMNEVILPNALTVTQQVNGIRQTTIANPLLSLYVNKVTVYLNMLGTSAFTVLSPGYLFLQGDYFFSLFKIGIFYPFDFLFLLLGGVFLFEKQKRLFYMLLLVLLISIIPQIVHPQVDSANFTPHIALMVPFILIIAACGIWHMVLFLQRKKLSYGVYIIVLIYLVSLGGFSLVYFYQLPLQHDYFNFSDRVMSRYITLNDGYKKPFIVYAHNPRYKFEEYLFYDNLVTKNTASEIAASLRQKQYAIDNVSFLPCPDHGFPRLSGSMSLIETQCNITLPQTYTPITIVQLSDSGGVYYVFNDRLCQKYPLHRYISQVTLSDFSVENMTPQKFCSTFLISSGATSRGS